METLKKYKPGDDIIFIVDFKDFRVGDKAKVVDFCSACGGLILDGDGNDHIHFDAVDLFDKKCNIPVEDKVWEKRFKSLLLVLMKMIVFSKWTNAIDSSVLSDALKNHIKEYKIEADFFDLNPRKDS